MNEQTVTRPDRRQVLAHIVARDDLPTPTTVSFGASGHTLTLTLSSYGDLRAWLPALGGVEWQDDRHLSDYHHLFSMVRFGDFLGYHGNAYCHEDAPPKPVVSADRAEEIRCELNGFIVHEFEHGTDLVNGHVLHVTTIVGSDFNHEKAAAWALNQPDVESVEWQGADPPEVTLVDGTVIVWSADVQAWEFAVPEVAS